MPKISALTAASAPDADDLLYIVEDGNSRKATVEQVGKAATNAAGDAPIYACRAWVNFDGTGTVAIRASGNVSSITDNGTGDYTVNFTTPMTDNLYAVSFSGDHNSGVILGFAGFVQTQSSGSVRVLSIIASGTPFDNPLSSVTIFR
jgi:hypothetical protein